MREDVYLDEQEQIQVINKIRQSNAKQNQIWNSAFVIGCFILSLTMFHFSPKLPKEYWMLSTVIYITTGISRLMMTTLCNGIAWVVLLYSFFTQPFTLCFPLFIICSISIYTEYQMQQMNNDIEELQNLRYKFKKI